MSRRGAHAGRARREAEAAVRARTHESLSELLAEGMLAPTGDYRPNRAGVMEPVYKTTEKGRHHTETNMTIAGAILDLVKLGDVDRAEADVLTPELVQAISVRAVLDVDAVVRFFVDEDPNVYLEAAEAKRAS